MVLIGRTLEPQTMWQTFTDFGLGWTDSVLGDIESKGKLEDPAYWHESTHQTLSYGYGLSVTTLQLARAYAAIGSGGRLPRISIEPLHSPPESRQAIDPDIAADLMAMLEVVVEDGTGRRAAIPNYRVAGKTGTAKIPVPGGYSPDRTHTVFAGIAPASRPRFAAVVVIGDPRGVQREGGQVAAPVFSRVVGTALRMYAIAPDAPDAESTLMSRAEVER
jgi:cell division protein FtsI (penicillin-binding protein 3)